MQSKSGVRRSIRFDPEFEQRLEELTDGKNKPGLSDIVNAALRRYFAVGGEWEPRTDEEREMAIRLMRVMRARKPKIVEGLRETLDLVLSHVGESKAPTTPLRPDPWKSGGQ